MIILGVLEFKKNIEGYLHQSLNEDIFVVTSRGTFGIGVNSLLAPLDFSKLGSDFDPEVEREMEKAKMNGSEYRVRLKDRYK